MAKLVTPIQTEKLKKLPKGFGAIAIGLIVLSFSVGVLFGQGKIQVAPKTEISSLSSNTSSTKLPGDLDYDSVEELYDKLRSKYDGNLSEAELLDGIKLGLAEASGDPYTTYFNPDESQAFEDDLNGSFEGIGAELSKKDGVIIVVAPLKDYPAEKAGIKPLDIISEINGEDALDLTVNEAVKKIRGEAGTDVTLTVIRDGKELNFVITREKISIPSVTSKLVDGKPEIGYIQISQFGDDTVSLTKKAVNDLKSQGAKKIILDLRSNPGGFLSGAVDVSSLWLEDGKVIVEEKRNGESIKKFTSSGDNLLEGVQTVVLVNEGSASASEIVAGALRDHKVATLIGTKTFGKGSVQEVVDLASGGSLKVTVARWFTPSGATIEKEGITPDKVVELPEDSNDTTDTQLNAAIEFLQ